MESGIGKERERGGEIVRERRGKWRPVCVSQVSKGAKVSSYFYRDLWQVWLTG